MNRLLVVQADYVEGVGQLGHDEQAPAALGVRLGVFYVHGPVREPLPPVGDLDGDVFPGLHADANLYFAGAHATVGVTHNVGAGLGEGQVEVEQLVAIVHGLGEDGHRGLGQLAAGERRGLGAQQVFNHRPPPS